MMAALVQSLPSPSSSTMTMLQSRSPNPDAYPPPHQQRNMQLQQHQHQHPPPPPPPPPPPHHHHHHQNPHYQPQRHVYTPALGFNHTTYRGSPSSPITPFAFNPNLHAQNNPVRQHPTMHPRYDNRMPLSPGAGHNNLAAVSPPSTSTTTRPRPLAVTSGAKSFPMPQREEPQQPFAPHDPNIPPSTPMMSYANVAKAAPDRYRRNVRRADSFNPPGMAPSSLYGPPPGPGSPAAAVATFYNHPTQNSSSPTLSNVPSYRGTASPGMHAMETPSASTVRPVAAQDDMNIHSRQSSSESAKRYRRRSISSLEAKDFTTVAPLESAAPQKPLTYAAMLASPAPADAIPRMPVVERKPVPIAAPPPLPASHAEVKELPRVEHDELQQPPSATGPQPVNDSKTGPPILRVNVPPRGSSEAAKKLGPSPLATAQQQPIPAAPAAAAAPARVSSDSQPATAGSAAAQQLAALNNSKRDDSKKLGSGASPAKSSRLRRAFSFGSAAELRKASAENNAQRNRLQKNQYETEEEAQQAAIAQQQEASGLGESIYSGQGHFFSGSTDNLSISSTASSASVMIRKMGKGMKKGTRSLAGLFRPKSIIGAPSASDATNQEASVGQVSMVTVEAEREKVNVNANPHDQPGGGTGFPKLERNSLDTNVNGNGDVGGASLNGREKDRSEVMAAVKKGILKRTESGNSSPAARPSPEYTLPQIPRIVDSPTSSAPSTPAEDTLQRSRSEGVVLVEGDEYFPAMQSFDTVAGMQQQQQQQHSASAPGTPRGGNTVLRAAAVARNISFSPRIQFHDTWPSHDYDRRGDTATCNRLTPMLAQQIKEELNTFKMEMEVHNESKVYTHFF